MIVSVQDIWKFTPKFDVLERPNNILVELHKTGNYNDKSLTAWVQKYGIHSVKYKSEACFSKFKEYINTWFKLKCKYNMYAVTWLVKTVVKMMKTTIE